VLEQEAQLLLVDIADHTAYDVRYRYRSLSRIAVVRRGQLQYLVIYSFKLKSAAFGVGSLLLTPVSFLTVRCVFLASYTAKVSEEVNRKCLLRTR